MATSFSARYLFPVGSPMVRDGKLIVDGRRIAEVSQGRDGVNDLGDAAIIPALVNAHTHLELSGFSDPLTDAQTPFAEWIEAIVTHSRATPPEEASVLAARHSGYAEASRDAGAIGDIATSTAAGADWDSGSACTIRFLELIGLSLERADGLLDSAREFLSSSTPAGHVRGLSPHAPYTIHPHLLREVCRLSADRSAPIAMHLAESPEELELISSQCGPLVEVLERLGAWDRTAIPRGVDTMFYLEMLAEAHRALVVHGTFLTTGELDFISQHDNLSVVYCPRTHAYFPHGDYRLQEMLDAGARIALGTDSRASNPDLSLFAEAQFVARTHSNVSPTEILKMATINGATAMGLGREFGCLESGATAQALVISLPDGVGEPEEALFHPDARVTHRIHGDRLVDLTSEDD